ncbi:MAG: AtpZ/AtpI family protein [Tissierellia bacterium]|nr:AtpZ/AtpI family protein [Tissierellia bacterium]
MKDNRDIFKGLAQISQIGLNIFFPVLGGILLGAWLDKKLGTAYLFLSIFGILGALSGLLNIIKLGRKL